MNLPQRLRDWLLERRIRKVILESEHAYRYCCSDCSAFFWRKAVKLMQQRSLQQLARMKGRGE